MTQKVALVGAGAMSGAIGIRLVETGNTLTVFDLDAEKIQALVARVGRPASSAAEAASVSDYVVTSLNSPEIVDVAVFGLSPYVDTGMLEWLFLLRHRFSGKRNVQAVFSQEREKGAAEIPLILAITCPDSRIGKAALVGRKWQLPKDMTWTIVGKHLDCRIHHYFAVPKTVPLEPWLFGTSIFFLTSSAQLTP